MRTVVEWTELLRQASRRVLTDPRLAFVRKRLPAECLEQEWLGYAGASEEELSAVEARLGMILPPSYKHFLRASNGWRFYSLRIGRFWSTQEVQWAWPASQWWIEIAEQGYGKRKIPDSRYFLYGPEQQTTSLRVEYLRHTLEISEETDERICLLNPKIVFEDGEWEAWRFGAKIPGAERFRSFEDMMVRLIE